MRGRDEFNLSEVTFDKPVEQTHINLLDTYIYVLDPFFSFIQQMLEKTTTAKNKLTKILILIKCPLHVRHFLPGENVR